MTIAKSIFIISILLLINKTASCQKNLLEIHYHQFDVVTEGNSFHAHTTYSNEAKQLASVFFLFYKEFISSQDMNSCVFHPSCSVYAMESIKTMGFLKGIASTFDRMSRCHPLAGKYYPIHPETKKLYDPLLQK